MTDHAVTYDAESVVRRDYPGDWERFADRISCTATFRTLDGESLATGAAVTPDGCSLDAVAQRGSRVLSAVFPGAGYQFQAGDLALLVSTGGPSEFVSLATCVVTAGAPTTAAITLRERLEETHPVDAALIPWWCSYSLDTTDTDAWPLGTRGTVTWQPDVAAPALVDTWQVRGLLRDAGSLRSVFAELFPRIHQYIRDDQHWAALLSHCEGNLADWLRGKGVQREALVDRGPTQRLLLVSVADHVAASEGEELAGENERIGKMLGDQRAIFLAVLHAQDGEQNHVIETTDNLHAQMPPVARQW